MKHVHFRRQVKTERAKQAIHQKRQILIQQISVSFLKCQKCLKTLNWARSGDKKNVIEVLLEYHKYKAGDF